MRSSRDIAKTKFYQVKHKCEPIELKNYNTYKTDKKKYKKIAGVVFDPEEIFGKLKLEMKTSKLNWERNLRH